MTASVALVVVVHGRPAPQGSKRHVGRGVLVESSRAVKPWRQAVSAATVDAIEHGDWQPEQREPYGLDVVFTLPRPTSHYRSGKHGHLLRDTAPDRPAVQPDLDKLLRSTLDGLADGGALVNDSRVVSIVARKAYPGGDLDALDGPGAVIYLASLT